MRTKGFVCMFMSLVLIALELQELMGFNFNGEILTLFGSSKAVVFCLQGFYGLILVYIFLVLMNSLSKVNFGNLIYIKSDQSNYFISKLTYLVLYSYVSYPLYYNFVENIMRIQNSHLTQV